MRMRFGGGSAVSEARLRGRLYGRPIGRGALNFSVIQTYNYNTNDAYSTGSQAIDAGIGTMLNFSSRTKFWVLGWGGLTVLGAVDSLPLGVTEKPEEGEPTAGQGVSEGPRFYDYGPGSDFGGLARLTRDGRDVALFFTSAVRFIRSTACGQTTSCSKHASTCSFPCMDRSESARPENSSTAAATTRTRITRSRRITIPSCART